MTKVHHVSGDAVAKALRQVADGVEEGIICGCSVEWNHGTGTARVAYVMAPGMDKDIELCGVLPESDE